MASCTFTFILVVVLSYFSCNSTPRRHIASNFNRDDTVKVAPVLPANTSTKMTDPDAVIAVAFANAYFGLRLYDAVKEEDGSNLLMSPFSVSSVMAMLSVGAKGRTLREIVRGMAFPEMGLLEKGYKNVFRVLQGNENMTLETANGLFVQEGFQLVQEFVNVLKIYFYTEAIQTNFAAREIAAKLINDWIEEKTKEKIKDLIEKDDLDNLTRLVLVNAIYFKSDWASKFDSKETRNGDFYVKEGKVVTVQMMNKRGKLMEKFKMTNIQDLKSQAIELPYKGNRVSMYIILPWDRFGLHDLEMNIFKMIDFLSLFSKIDAKPAEPVNLSLPKFKLEKTIDLEDHLKNLGMGQMFTEAADFSGMTATEDLKVSKASQKAFIQVNEEGSEATAATIVVVNGRSRTPQFVCDHPFMFFIFDKLTSMVLFSGRIVNPTVD